MLLRELYWDIVCLHPWRYIPALLAIAAVLAAFAVASMGPVIVAGGAVVFIILALGMLVLTAEPLRERFSWTRRAMELPVTWHGELTETPDLQHDCEVHLTYHGFGKREITARLVDVQHAEEKGSLGFKFQWVGESDSRPFRHMSRGTIKLGRLQADGKGNWYFLIDYIEDKSGPVPQPVSCRYSWRPDPRLKITNYPTMLRTPLTFIVEITDENGRSKEIPVNVVVTSKTERRPIQYPEKVGLPSGSTTTSEKLCVVLE